MDRPWYQRLILVVAALDLLFLILMPPFQDTLWHGAACPDWLGFSPLLMAAQGRTIYAELLTLELMFVSANAATA